MTQTNYIDRLDPAFLRPGRIDRKIEYDLATAEQAYALFARFFPEDRFPYLAASSTESEKEKETLADLAERFASDVPACEFSTAELQGFLQGFKMRPVEAAQGVAVWVEDERRDRRAREEREEERRRKAKMRMQQQQMGGGFGTMPAMGAISARREREDGEPRMGRKAAGLRTASANVPAAEPTTAPAEPAATPADPPAAE